MSQTTRMLSALLGLAIAVTYLAATYAYEGRAHVMPNLIGWTAVALTLIDVLAQTNTRIGRGLSGVLSGRPIDAADEGTGVQTSTLTAVSACFWVAFFVGLVTFIGFIAAIPVYTLGFMLIQGRMPWLTSILSAVAITAVTWVVFEKLLSYKVFEGILFGGQI